MTSRTADPAGNSARASSPCEDRRPAVDTPEWPKHPSPASRLGVPTRAPVPGHHRSRQLSVADRSDPPEPRLHDRAVLFRCAQTRGSILVVTHQQFVDHLGHDGEIEKPRLRQCAPPLCGPCFAQKPQDIGMISSPKVHGQRTLFGSGVIGPSRERMARRHSTVHYPAGCG
jgi:hypothetical protein